MSGKSLRILDQAPSKAGTSTGGCSSGGCSTEARAPETASTQYAVNPALTSGLSDAERKELEAFAASEAKNLGITEAVQQWFEPPTPKFTKSQRNKTTIWVSGLTWSQDLFLAAALRGIGYDVKTMPVPDNSALRLGKEFGNRGQCNPTYFTVGNLVKHLIHLRDERGVPTDEIIRRYVFLTAGACGPCRFGTYVTEYRKALVDSGFQGFRVLLFQQQGGLKQATGEAAGLELNTRFFKGVLQAVMAGDCINLAGYRIRPYEVTKGDTDAALEECKTLLRETLKRRGSMITALLRCKHRLNKIAVNRLRPKPKVSIIGEFWAMTTEGDGNHRLQRFLEQEGAEVEIQPVIAWVLYNIWEHQHDTRKRMTLKQDDAGIVGLQGKDGRTKLALLWGAEKAVRGIFGVYCSAIGL